MHPESAPVLWLERLTSSSNSTNLLLNESLACSTVTLWIMEKHCWSWLRQHNGCLHHGSILQTICGCSGISIFYGNPGSCKSEALKCGQSLFGAYNIHFYNSQTTPSFFCCAQADNCANWTGRHQWEGTKYMRGVKQCQYSLLIGDLHANNKEYTHAALWSHLLSIQMNKQRPNVSINSHPVSTTFTHSHAHFKTTMTVFMPVLLPWGWLSPFS